MDIMNQLEAAQSSLRQGQITREQIEDLQRGNELLQAMYHQINVVIDALWAAYKEQEQEAGGQQRSQGDD